MLCDITPHLEKFTKILDKVTTEGDTTMYDALALAKNQLDAFVASNPAAAAGGCKKRILCLSDGCDTGLDAFDLIVHTWIHLMTHPLILIMTHPSCHSNLA